MEMVDSALMQSFSAGCFNYGARVMFRKLNVSVIGVLSLLTVIGFVYAALYVGGVSVGLGNNLFKYISFQDYSSIGVSLLVPIMSMFLVVGGISFYLASRRDLSLLLFLAGWVIINLFVIFAAMAGFNDYVMNHTAYVVLLFFGGVFVIGISYEIYDGYRILRKKVYRRIRISPGARFSEGEISWAGVAREKLFEAVAAFVLVGGMISFRVGFLVVLDMDGWKDEIKTVVSAWGVSYRCYVLFSLSEFLVMNCKGGGSYSSREGGENIRWRWRVALLIFWGAEYRGVV